MGKTKTAVVSVAPGNEKSGEEKYKERQKKKKREKEADKIRVPGLGGGERVVAVGTEPLSEESEEKEEKTSKKEYKPKVRGKKYKKARKKVDKSKTYSLNDALKLVKETSYAKFDGSVELHMKVKKDNILVNVELPYSNGKDQKVEIADKKTIEKLKKGNIDFDILMATAEMMPKIVPFAKLLGPKGLMPNPKNGTLIKEKKEADKFKGNNLQVKTEKKQPVIHTVVGKVSQKDKEVKENIQLIIEAVGKKQIEKAHLTSTMSPSVKISV
jgi:large subunit ribosomal protein L1